MTCYSSQRLIPATEPRVRPPSDILRIAIWGPDPNALQVGVRMRYRITRRVAPYVGWEREYGYGGSGRQARGRGYLLTMKSAGWLGYAAGFERSCPVKHHNQ